MGSLYVGMGCVNPFINPELINTVCTNRVCCHIDSFFLVFFFYYKNASIIYENFLELLTDWIHVWKRHILCGHGIQERKLLSDFKDGSHRSDASV